MKVALVHDQLHEFGGAERVFLVFAKMFPDADIYTAFCTKENLAKHVPDYNKWKIHESFVANIPFIRKLYSPLRFLAPKIWESFDFSGYDLVLSSSGWYMCKGIKTVKPTIHISYVHHPPRYLYGYETAMEWKKYVPIRIYAHIVNHFLRIWDFESTKRPNYLIANSVETKRRIEKFYRRDSTVIYPPVSIPQDLDDSRWKIEDRNYYLTISRLQKAKHVEILIQAANKEKFKLKIVGEGKDRVYLESIAGPTVEFLGRVKDESLAEVFAGAKAFLFASVDEEFGIAPVEAMGHGVPVVAYASGGLLETVIDGLNGYLFDNLSVEALLYSIDKLNALSKQQYHTMCKSAYNEAKKYSEDVFKKEMMKFIAEKVKK